MKFENAKAQNVELGSLDIISLANGLVAVTGALEDMAGDYLVGETVSREKYERLHGLAMAADLLAKLSFEVLTPHWDSSVLDNAGR